MYSNRHTLERKTTKCDHRLCALYDYEDFGSIKSINRKKIQYAHNCSVADLDPDPNPDPDSPDPRVFGPPGSGSISQRYGSGSRSFYHQAKIVRKT